MYFSIIKTLKKARLFFWASTAIKSFKSFKSSSKRYGVFTGGITSKVKAFKFHESEGFLYSNI